MLEAGLLMSGAHRRAAKSSFGGAVLPDVTFNTLLKAKFLPHWLGGATHYASTEAKYG